MTQQASGGPAQFFSSLFGRSQAAQAPAPQQQQLPTPGSSMQPNNPSSSVPNADPAPPAPSPLEAYKDLWKTPENHQPATDPFSQPLFSSDPTKLREAITKTDFLQGIPPDVMQKAMSGQDPQSFLAVVNHVGQQSLSMALQLSTAMQEQAGATLGKRFNEVLPNRLSEFQLNQTPPSNPILQNPAVAPMLDMIRQQMRMKHPDKPVSEVNKMAEQYFTDFASVLAGGKSPTSGTETGQNKEMDWSAFAGM